jgi:hypothetical protein
MSEQPIQPARAQARGSGANSAMSSACAKSGEGQ